MTARKQLIIRVTARDIDLGIRGACDFCPIVHSLRRRYPGVFVHVDYDSAQIGERMIPITGKMETWMNAFDAGERVKPTAFFMDVAA